MTNKVIVRKERFSIVKSKSPMKDAFVNINDGKEITAIIDENKIEKNKIKSIEKGLKCITFNIILPSSMTGFIAKVSSALARKKIPIFVISSYSTDHILIKEKFLKKAIKTLRELK